MMSPQKFSNVSRIHINNKREFKKFLCYIVNFMQAFMAEYYVEPENKAVRNYPR